jgi:hypothetical protein
MFARVKTRVLIKCARDAASGAGVLPRSAMFQLQLPRPASR